MAFPERVVDFGENGAEPMLPIEAEPQAYGIERIAEEAGQCKQDDFAVGFGEVLRFQNAPYPFAGWRAAIAVVRAPQAEEIGTVD